VVGQTFLQIVGMCVIVVKFLFPNAPKASVSSRKQISSSDPED
jgi:hypothetical protein